ncbi:hypothetical protein QVD17_23435 [Tagetes erecta]|uniref:Uncharacterized protein n=1 Tax=Tagetes erecta TaxID=13708 RepID=A0AAD8NUI7_TARER|nr:hypothetical protein QVD17_23435 [Tagetes erecta]
MNVSKKTVTLSKDQTPVPERSRLESPAKSNFQVFMFGFGTGKFPTKMELSDIKKRQLRQPTMPDGDDEESDRRKKRWWVLIDAFRCGGAYQEKVAMKDVQTTSI